MYMILLWIRAGQRDGLVTFESVGGVEELTFWQTTSGTLTLNVTGRISAIFLWYLLENTLKSLCIQKLIRVSISWEIIVYNLTVNQNRITWWVDHVWKRWRSCTIDFLIDNIWDINYKCHWTHFCNLPTIFAGKHNQNLPNSKTDKTLNLGE